MNRQLKFRIWNKQHKVWLENDASLHCFSNWSICPFTGKLTDYVGVISSDFDAYSASPAPDYYTTADGIVKESPYVIQQFTGLKDKNGKEIFEGDIILNNIDHNNPVLCVAGWSVYEDIGFVLYYPSKEPMEPLKQNFNGIDLYEGLPMCYGRGCGYEVISNIFETPELLK